MTDFLSYYSGSLNNLCLWDCFYYLSLCFPFAYFFPISFSYFNTFILFLAALGVTVWHGLSLAVERESVPLLQRAGSLSQWLLLLWSTGSRAQGLRLAGSVVHGLSCPRGMWHLPGPGLEPGSPVAAGHSQPLDHQRIPCTV